MRSVQHKRFLKAFSKLRPEAQEAATMAYKKWCQSPELVGWKSLAGTDSLFSAHVGYGARAIALVTRDSVGGPLAVWLWVGSHEAYNTFVNEHRHTSVADVVAGLNPGQRRDGYASSLAKGEFHPGVPKVCIQDAIKSRKKTDSSSNWKGSHHKIK
jgi:hypothetical protein